MSQLGAPWGFRVAASPDAKFHFVLGGAAVLTLDDRPSTRLALRAGDLVLLPHGAEHVIQDDPSSQVRPLERILVDHPVDESARLAYGGPGPITTLLCGAFETGILGAELSMLLPSSLVLDGASGAIARWIGPILEVLREEHAAGEAGAGAVLSKIADVFLTDMLRRFLAGSDGLAVARVAVAGDAAIAEAVRAVRDQPDAAWTVASLARQVGMSRSAFAARFRQLVGDSPIAYVAKVRLSHGAGLLSTSRASVAQVARAVGYDNEASFSKAFKRVYGRSPGAFRSAFART